MEKSKREISCVCGELFWGKFIFTMVSLPSIKVVNMWVPAILEALSWCSDRWWTQPEIPLPWGHSWRPLPSQCLKASSVVWCKTQIFWNKNENWSCSFSPRVFRPLLSQSWIRWRSREVSRGPIPSEDSMVSLVRQSRLGEPSLC